MLGCQLKIISLLAVGLSILVGPAFAATATTTIPVSLAVSAACTVQATSMDFGTAGTSVAVATTGTITVTCATGVPYNVTLSGGVNYSVCNGAQRVLSGSGPLTCIAYYELYKDSAHTQVWGDQANGNTYPLGSGLTGTGNGSGQVLPVYGLVPITPSIAGTITDTVTVTVIF